MCFLGGGSPQIAPHQRVGCDSSPPSQVVDSLCWFRVFCSLSETITAPFFFRRSPVKSTTLTQQMGGRTAFVERAHARTHAIARHLFFFRLQNKKSALMVTLPLPRLTLVRAPLLLPNPKLAPAHAPVPASASRTNWGVFTHPLTHSLYRWHGGVVPPPPPPFIVYFPPPPPQVIVAKKLSRTFGVQLS